MGRLYSNPAVKTSITSGSPSLLRSLLTLLPPIAAACLALVFAPSAGAYVTISDYNVSGSSLASSTNAYTNDTNIITGSGVSGDFQFETIESNCYAAPSNDLPLTEAAAVSGSDYISFTITPKSNSLNYDTLFFNLCGNANNINPSNPYDGEVVVRSSVDNFTTDLVSGSTGALTPGENTELGLGADPGSASNLSFPIESSPVEFRFYFFDNEGTGGSFCNVGVTNIILTANVVPEPSTWADLHLAAGGLTLVLKRHPASPASLQTRS